MLKWLRLILMVSTLLIPFAYGNLSLQINKGKAKAISIAIVPFGSDSNSILPVDIASVISSDLKISGKFESVNRNSFVSFPTDVNEIYFPDWKKLHAQYVVIGNISKMWNKKYVIKYDLFDVHNKKIFLSGKIEGLPSQLRDVSHSISDQVYKKITGVRGIFATKILYVLVKNRATKSASYHLVCSDIDGKRPVTIVSSSQPIATPTWSPDSKKVAYVTYTNDHRPIMYLQDLATGQREILIKGYALVTSPSFSPDGVHIAMTLSLESEDGTHIYIKNLRTNKLTKITTDHYVLDTEPSWMPDCKNIVFTSNRGGSAQIYSINIYTKEIQRKTFAGNFNARATVFPDGERLAFIAKESGEIDYHLAVLSLKKEQFQILSKEPFADSPSIAPNGQMLVFSMIKDNNYVLEIITIDGRSNFQLPLLEGDIQDPSWSPFM